MNKPRPKKTKVYKGGTPTKTKVKMGYMRKALRAKVKSFTNQRRGR
jgi:hypothetical protein